MRPDLLFKQIGDEPVRMTRFTTDPLNMAISRSRLDIRKNSYAVRVAGEWNTLSHETKSSRSVAIFKNAIKTPLVPGSTVGGHWMTDDKLQILNTQAHETPLMSP